MTTESTESLATSESACPPRRLRRRRRLLIFLGLLLALWLTRAKILTAVGGFLAVADPLQPVDAIVVLSGGAGQRAPYAAELYKQGISKTFLCIGKMTPGDLEVFNIKVRESEITAKMLKERGVPEENIIVVTNTGASTWDEAVETRRQADQRGWRSLLIISNKAHMRRARLAFRHTLKGTGVRVFTSPTPWDEFRADAWWKNERDLVDVQNEYIKLALYAYYCVKNRPLTTDH